MARATPSFIGKIRRAAHEWDNKFLRASLHSVRLYEDPTLVEEVIEEFLSKETRGAFKATNPFSKRIWMKELIDHFIRYGHGSYELGWDHELSEGRIACVMATFTHEDWVCADTNIKFDLDSAKQKIRNALQGLSYIACFEAVGYVNEHWTTGGVRGRLVSFHCHVLLWATSRNQLNSRRKRIKKRFMPVLGSRTGVRYDSLKHNSERDMCRILAYQAKLPFLGKRTVLNASGRPNQVDVELPRETHFRLITAMQKYDLLDLWFAGGEGSTILDEARFALTPHRKAHSRLEWLRRHRGRHRRPSFRERYPLY
jgi:hypothetical protein